MSESVGSVGYRRRVRCATFTGNPEEVEDTFAFDTVPSSSQSSVAASSSLKRQCLSPSSPSSEVGLPRPAASGGSAVCIGNHTDAAALPSRSRQGSRDFGEEMVLESEDEQRVTPFFYALPNTATACTSARHSNASEPIALTLMETPTSLNCLDAVMNYGTPFRQRCGLPEPVLDCPSFVNAFFGRDEAHVLCFTMSGSQAIHASLQASFRLTQARPQTQIALSTWYNAWGYLAYFQPPHLLRRTQAKRAPEGIQSVRHFIGYHTDYTAEYDAALEYWLRHNQPQPDQDVSWDRVKLTDWRSLCEILTGLESDKATEVADVLLSRASDGTWDGTLPEHLKALTEKAPACNAFLIELVLSSADSAMPIAWARLISRLCALFHIVLTIDEAITCCRTGPGIFLARMLGVMPTLSIFSKALFPSGVVWHETAPARFRSILQQDRVAPFPTAWLTVSLATEMNALMLRLDSKQLMRNFLLGRIVRGELSSAILARQGTHCAHAHIRGVGLLVYVDGAAVYSGTGGICFKHKRLILPFDLTLQEIKTHLAINTDCPKCTGGLFGASRTGGATRSRAAHGAHDATLVGQAVLLGSYLDHTHYLARERSIVFE